MDKTATNQTYMDPYADQDKVSRHKISRIKPFPVIGSFPQMPQSFANQTYTLPNVNISSAPQCNSNGQSMSHYNLQCFYDDSVFPLYRSHMTCQQQRPTVK